VPAPRFIAEDDIAIRGHDPVSYSDGTPRPGSPALELEWSGRTWRFATPLNRERFAREPERYAPQYGGHCALAMSLGQVAPGSPSAWSLEHGKLYFHNSAVTAFLFKYLPGRLAAADARWSALTHPRHDGETSDGTTSL